MAISQSPQVNPPLSTDKELTDYSAILQRLFKQLFQAAHTHVGKNGILMTVPTASQGSIGDVVIGIVSGTAYIFFKVTDTDWYKISGTHV
jgi:hypothetical protein